MSLRLLVVEDDAVCREAVARGLSALGWDVRTTADFDEALRLAFGWAPQAVLIDWNLNRPLDGVDLAVYLRGMSPEVGVVLMTGSDLGRLRRRAAVREVSPCELLAKPFTLDDLQCTLTRALHLAPSAAAAS